MKNIYIIIGFLLISFFTMYVLFHASIIQPYTPSKENKREKQTNTISYGLKDNQGQHINNGSEITSENNTINVSLSFIHNIDEDRKYGLIVLEDYVQKPFKIENTVNELSHYSFDMKPNNSITTKISLHTSPNASELAFLIIKKPEYKLKDNDLHKASILEEILSMRYSIHHPHKESETLKFTPIQPHTILKDGLYEPLFVTSNEEKLQTVFSEKEGETLTLSNGNETKDEIPYAIVAFKDWEQVELFHNKNVAYTTVAPETRQTFTFTLPTVEQESNFQLVAFPFPYKVSEDHYVSQQAYGSFRIVIENKK
ncbi:MULTISPECIES: hypothetical protein [Bacillus]|uniref:hypothetical protein n=1 Tax=Bacillus TaxID=1386 RepID=UPI000BF22BE9|nr:MULTISPECIES: hypothetical protein [Bacillus]MBJ8066737.1 hypothetical protein [Bacillus cereus group sp. N15]MCS3599696.1 hypothetical protein [Bacillus sp. JUb91]PEI94503.1 hypothetical protein CN671_29875 [Bacillus toyonensis]PFZ64699.1 hypothetical protein COL72_31505 [Bacillus toyonensis]TBX41671.1 hypothetical protein E0M44_24405 [Bacillus toyonensis]